MKWDVFTQQGAKLGNIKISLSKSGGFGFLAGFYNKNNLKRFVYLNTL